MDGLVKLAIQKRVDSVVLTGLQVESGGYSHQGSKCSRSKGCSVRLVLCRL
jgi:hypothetical protein